MRRMGIEAIYRRPNTSKPAPGHRIYPYLLRGLTINRPNHVWATDISYIPMARGFVYLTSVMDWITRRILARRLSNTMEASFCIDAVEEALAKHGCPQIFNTDQCSQFTSTEFTTVLINIAMSKAMSILAPFLFFAAAPVVVVGLVPWWIMRWDFQPAFWDSKSPA